jgi:hypothetical protein
MTKVPGTCTPKPTKHVVFLWKQTNTPRRTDAHYKCPPPPLTLTERKTTRYENNEAVAGARRIGWCGLGLGLVSVMWCPLFVQAKGHVWRTFSANTHFQWSQGDFIADINENQHRGYRQFKVQPRYIWNKTEKCVGTVAAHEITLCSVRNAHEW